MATLLDGVNAVLKRVKLITGDSGELTTLTDSARQSAIDVCVQNWNEAVEQLYTTSGRAMPKESTEATITLATGDRDYALAADMVQLHWPFHDRTNGYYIFEWKEGYHDLILRELQPDQWQGRAIYGAIRPTDDELFLSHIPQAEENGDVYTYLYDKDVSLAQATDTFPFKDAVYRALIPVVAQLWQRDRNRDFDAGITKTNYGRASLLLSQQQRRDSWLPR